MTSTQTDHTQGPLPVHVPESQPEQREIMHISFDAPKIPDSKLRILFRGINGLPGVQSGAVAAANGCVNLVGDIHTRRMLEQDPRLDGYVIRLAAH